MDWEELLISIAVNRVIEVAKRSDGKGKWRPRLMKVFRTIAVQIASEAEIAEVHDAVKKGTR